MNFHLFSPWEKIFRLQAFVFSGNKMVRWLMLHCSHGLLSHTIPAKTEGDDDLRICVEKAQVA